MPGSTLEAIAGAEDRLVRAGAALRQRPRERTLESLAAVFDAWSEPGGRWQRRLVAELPAATGFSAPNVEEGLARALASWNGEALREWVTREIGESSTAVGFDQTRVLLAGSIPMPTMLSLVAPLILHSPVLAKTASRDPVTAHVFEESLAAVDPELAAALEIVSFPGDDSDGAAAFVSAGCVVATGSDETVADVARLVAPGTRLVTYGHRLSIAVLGPLALSPESLSETARLLALDVALWDQLGCLSPVAVYCASDTGATRAVDVGQVSEALALALEEVELRLPRGELPTATAAATRAERDGAQMRCAAGEDVSVRGDDRLRWTVIREPDAHWRAAPLHRFLRVHPVHGREALLAAVAPLSRHLAAVALDGFDNLANLDGGPQSLSDDLRQIGASRICRPGTLQTPPIGWHHDAEPLLTPLVRD